MVSAVYQVTCGVSTTLSQAQQRVVRRHRFDGEHVQSRGGQPARAQRIDQRVLVDDRSAGGVDQHGIVFHRGQRVVGRARLRWRRSAAGAARRCRSRPAGRAAVASRGGRRRGCWCAAPGRPSPPTMRSTRRGDVAVADQPDGAAADVADRLAERGVRRPALRRRGWPGRVRAAGAARPASAARCPRRPTGRSRRACSPPRCRVGSRRRRRWCSRRRRACARAAARSPGRGRRRRAAAARARSPRPRATRGRTSSSSSSAQYRTSSQSACGARRSGDLVAGHEVSEDSHQRRAIHSAMVSAFSVRAPGVVK